MIKYVLSKTYVKKNSTCYEMYLDSNFKGLKVIPNDGYIFKVAEDEFVEGYIQLSEASIESEFDKYEAILKESIHKGE